MKKDKIMNSNIIIYIIAILIIIGVIVLFIIHITFDLFDRITLTKECKEKYPNEEFCNLVKGGIECGYKCTNLNLKFYHYESGGLFGNSDCICINDNNEITRLY